jgi:hypothetical protein
MSIRRGDARIPYRQKRKGVPNSTGAICSAFPGCAKLNPGILVSSEWRVSFVASVENPPQLLSLSARPLSFPAIGIRLQRMNSCFPLVLNTYRSYTKGIFRLGYPCTDFLRRKRGESKNNRCVNISSQEVVAKANDGNHNWQRSSLVYIPGYFPARR